MRDRDGSAVDVDPKAEREEGASPPPAGQPWTVLRLIRWSARYLEEKGVEEGRLDGEHLLAHALGSRRLDLYLQFDRPLDEDELDRFKPLLLRRARREPLQHILGRVSFRELELRVDGRALVPRPETEVLVGAVLDQVRKGPGDRTALDVGTGTGAIALSLIHEGPFSRVVATDSSADALALAAENRDELAMGERVELRRGSLLEPVAEGERFHVLVSNPPYIAEGDREVLDPEVRDWEPAPALFAGPDGLDVIRPLVRESPGVLHSGGLLALEVGTGQAAQVAELVRETDAFRDVRIMKDLAGRDRIVLGRMKDTARRL